MYVTPSHAITIRTAYNIQQYTRTCQYCMCIDYTMLNRYYLLLTILRSLPTSQQRPWARRTNYLPCLHTTLVYM